MHLNRMLALAVLTIGTVPTFTQYAVAGSAAIVPHYEKVEWTWADRPVSIDAHLPSVLLVGDSITRNYYPFVAEALAGRANVFLFATSASVGDRRLEGQIADYARMIDWHFAVVHFNNGMYGWGYAEQDYGGQLGAFVSALRAASPDAKLIWASTTPVRKDIADGATNTRINARNALAARIMSTESIPVDDQHTLMTGKSLLYSDDVHFGVAGAAIQGKSVAASITYALLADHASN